MDFTPQNVENVLIHFYNSNFSGEANQWLIMAQQSKEAWEFAWNFMAPSKSEVVQFFGATTLCYKVMQHYRELTVERGLELRNGLMHKLLEFSSGPRGVLSKLCVALAHVTFRLCPDEWPAPLGSFIEFFNSDEAVAQVGGDRERTHLVLLELLRYLPEEFYTAFLPAHRRAGVKAALQREVELVMNLFEGLLNSEARPNEVYNGCIVACCSWLHFSVSFAERTALVQRFFAALNDPALFDTAVECLCNVFSHPDTLKYPLTIEKLLPFVIGLQSMLDKSIANEDMEMCAGLTRLLATLCESQCKLLLDLACRSDEEEGCKLPLQLVKMMLQCTSLPGHYPADETVSEMALSFWYILQEDIISSDEGRCQRLIQLFYPTYITLMHVLMSKAQYPEWENFQRNWSADDKEKFRCYRQDIADTMMSSYSILREPFLNHIYACLFNVRQRKLSGEKVRWQEVESLLFLLCAVAENINIEHESCVAYIFAIMNDIELDHPKSVETALEMISAFQEWMTCHPEVLACVISPVLRCLHDNELRSSAAMCLRDLCNVNQEHLLPYVDAILTNVHQVLAQRDTNSPAAGATSSTSTTLSVAFDHSRECAVLMSCVGYCLAMLTDRDQIRLFMERLVTPEVDTLRALVAQPAQPSLQAPIRCRLMMLAYLFSSLQRSLESSDHEDLEGSLPAAAVNKSDTHSAEIILSVLEGILPLLEALTHKWLGDAAILESLTELFRWTLRNALEGFEPVVAQVAALVSNMYNARPQASLLDLAKQIIVWFSASEKLRPRARALLASVCARTMAHMREHEAQLRNVTDLVEAYMWLLHHVLKRRAALLAEAGIAPQPGGDSADSAAKKAAEGVDLGAHMRLAMCGLAMPEQGTVKSSCLFLAELIAKGAQIGVAPLIESLGPALNDRLLRCIAGESPRQVIEFLAEVYQPLNSHFAQHQRRWLNDLLSRRDYPSPRVSREEKQRFLGVLLTPRSSKRVIKDAIREFSLKCLGVVSSQVGFQSSQDDGFDCAIAPL